MAKDYLVVIEHDGKALRKISHETLSVARKLADEAGATVTAALLGEAVDGLCAQCGTYGADKVLVAENENLARYTAQGYVKVLGEMVASTSASAVFMGFTPTGRDLGPRLAAHLEGGYMADLIELKLEDDALVGLRPMYAGKALATVKVKEGAPAIIALRPKAFEVKEAPRESAKETIDAGLSAGDIRAVVKDCVAKASARLDVSEADVIVSGGGGLKGPEGFKPLEDLADVLGAAVGASRRAVDEGWRPHSDQIGQTGKVVNPKLYIACGISGKIQHLVGMRSAKFIVAINKNPDEPIFQAADYGIVGDLFKVVPALTEEFKKVV